jgi:hypothetical protein
LPEALSQDIHKQWLSAIPESSSLVNRELEYLLCSPEGLQAVLLTLRDTERHTLCLIAAAFASEPFDDTKLLKQGRLQLSGAALKVGLMRLCRKGIVFSLRKSWGEQLYMLPTDTYKIWLKLLFPECLEQNVELDTLEVKSLTLERSLPSARLLTLLAYCDREGLPVTRKGVIVKRNLVKLKRLLHIEEYEIRLLHVRYTWDDTYPFSFAAVLDGGLRQGLLELRKEGYVLNKHKLHDWLSLSEPDMNRVLYDQLISSLMPAIPGMRHWITFSEEIPPGQWFSVTGIINSVNTQLGMGKELVQQERIVAEWLEPLSLLGYMELGHDRNGQLLTRYCAPMTSSEAHLQASLDSLREETIFVQPDFEIIVPPGVPYQVLWLLEHLGELEQAGTVSRYRLSKERVQQSLEAGWCGEEMIALLRKHAKFGLPELVEYSLRQWIAQWENDGKNKCNPPRSDRDAASISECGDVPKQQVGGDVTQGLIYSRESVQYYDIERTIPRTEDLYPGLAEVPNMWLKELRSYHAATRIDMIRKALEWSACVRIRQAGEVRLLVPERIEGTLDNWLVCGFNPDGEIMLAPNQWEEMQLVLPGINDES